MGKATKAGDKKPPTDLSYVVVEGCIGVGKTTLTHLLADRLNARRIVEVVDENPFLPDFYRDQKAHAFKTQMFFLLSRFKQQEQIRQPDLFRANVIADYMFAKDRIFAELTLTGSELALYHQVFDALYETIKIPDLVVHLRAPLEVILERIQRRGREFEKDIDPGYLRSLVEGYEEYFSRYKESALLIVDTERLNFPENPQDMERVFESIVSAAAAGGTHRLSHQTKTLRQPSLIEDRP